jgi:hypothetical protein
VERSPSPFCPDADLFVVKLKLDTRNGTGYVLDKVIQKFKQKGLKQFFESGNASVVNAQHVTRIRLARYLQVEKR